MFAAGAEAVALTSTTTALTCDHAATGGQRRGGFPWMLLEKRSRRVNDD